MYDMKQLQIRYFKVRLPDGQMLEIEPPKMKVLKKIMALSTVGDDLTNDDLDGLIEGLSLVLTKNKQSREVTTNWIYENMNIDEVIDLLQAYFLWVAEIRSSKN